MKFNYSDGQAFGTWTIIKEVLSTNGCRYFKCICSCGKTKNVSITTLRRKPLHCYYCENDARKRQDLTNKRFGKWLVSHKNQNGTWACVCDCGTKLNITTGQLKSHHSTKCKSCVNYGDRPRPKIGDVFGLYTLVNITKDRFDLLVYHCRCSLCDSVVTRKYLELITPITSTGCKYCRQEKGFEEISQGYFNQIYKGAIRRSFSFDITIEDIWSQYMKQDRRCNLTNIPVQFYRRGKNKPVNANTASVDRVDSTKGYSIDNIQIIYAPINVMKMSLSQDEFICFCNMVAKKYPISVNPSRFLTDERSVR